MIIYVIRNQKVLLFPQPYRSLCFLYRVTFRKTESIFRELSSCTNILYIGLLLFVTARQTIMALRTTLNFFLLVQALFEVKAFLHIQRVNVCGAIPSCLYLKLLLVSGTAGDKRRIQIHRR